MKIQVLISAMHQKDFSLMEKTNIQSDAVVINQCDRNSIDRFSFPNKFGNECKIIYINTTERGLSKSRNMAIENASADICLICDDDEILEDGYYDILKKAFEEFSDDVIAFKLNHPTRKFKNKTYKIGFFKAATIGSWQLAFRLKSVKDARIRFNEKMGSGTPNGSGEENKFVMDCRKNGLKVRYVPELIGTLKPDGESQWFHGYDEKYWVNRGWQSKMIFGRFWGFIYMWYYFINKKEDTHNKKWDIIKWMSRGFKLRR